MEKYCLDGSWDVVLVIRKILYNWMTQKLKDYSY